MARTLLAVIESLDRLEDGDRFSPLIIYAENGPDAAPGARAMVCPGDEEGSLACPLDSSLTEVLMVSLAKEAIEVWSSWRGGRSPTAGEKFDAVMFYARTDAYLPAEGDASFQTTIASTSRRQAAFSAGSD
jgi:hypothetical protein